MREITQYTFLILVCRYFCLDLGVNISEDFVISNFCKNPSNS